MCKENYPIKEKCPVDADSTQYADMCRDISPMGEECTRLRRHKGKHHLHGILTKRCYEIWE